MDLTTLFGHAGYVLLGISPIGGTLASIPFGLFQMKYSAVFVALSSPFLAYVQVIVVDVLWDALNRWHWFQQTLEKRRSERVEKLLASGGSFWATLFMTPLIGPWVVMAFMRYAHVPQRKVALPMFISLLVASGVFVALWIYAPELVKKLVG